MIRLPLGSTDPPSRKQKHPRPYVGAGVYFLWNSAALLALLPVVAHHHTAFMGSSVTLRRYLVTLPATFRARDSRLCSRLAR